MVASLNLKKGDSFFDLSLKYVNIVRKFLWITGSWPGHVFGEKIPFIIRYHKYIILANTVIITLGEIAFLVRYQKHMTFMAVGHVVLTIFLTALTCIRALVQCLPYYPVILKKFLMEFHLIHHKHKGSYDLKMFKILEKLSYYFTLFQMTMMMGGMCLFNLLPAYNSYQAGAFRSLNHENLTLEYSVYYYLPGFNCLDHYYISTALNLYFSYGTSSYVCCLDLLLSLIVFQIIGHILILKNNIESIPRPKKNINIYLPNYEDNLSLTVDICDDQENEEINKMLIDIIKYHKYIVGFADDVSNMFGPMLAINYMFHLVSGCVLLLECSRPEPETLARFGPLTFIVFGQLIQISVTFEIVGYMSEKLIDTVYCMPWECMNISNQKTVRFLLNRVQTPIQLTALGMVPVGVQTMQSILKTTLSYFTFLKSMNE